MAAKQKSFALAVQIWCDDKITGPLNAINKSLNKTFAPVRKLQTGLSALAGGSGFTGVRNAANGLYSSVQRTSHEVSNLTGTMMRLNIIAASAGYIFNKTFIGNADFFERMNISLTAIEGSADKAAESMAFLKKMTVDTPFGIEELSKAYRVMKGFGLDPQKNNTMQSVVDQVAKLGGTADDITGIAMQLGQAYSKNRLQAQDANILVERGVPVWGLLQRAVKRLNPELNITVAKLREMSENGELGADAINQLIKQMGIESKGASLNMMVTWSGMISQIKDQWMFFSTELMNEGPFQYLKGELKGILDWVDKMKKSGEWDKKKKEWGTNLVAALKELKTILIGVYIVAKFLWKNAIEPLKNLMGGWTNVVAALAGIMLSKLVVALMGNIAGFISLTATVLRFTYVLGALALANPAITLIGASLLAIGYVAYKVYRDWDNVKSWLIGIWDSIAKSFKDAWDGVFGWIDAKIDALVGKFRAMGESIRSVLSYIPGLGTTNESMSRAFGPPAPVIGGSLAGAAIGGRAEVNVNFSNVPPGTTVRPGKNSNVPLNLDVGRMMISP